MKKTSNKVDIFAIVFIGLITFGLQIPTLGFFQDDWNFVFYSSARGPQGLLEFLTVDGRPGATWIYILGFSVFGYKPALWQFFSLLLRILTTINIWVVLKTLWPNRRYSNLVVSILFLAYPFFTLQPLSVAYAPHFAAYFFYSLSILLMIKAVERPAQYVPLSATAILFTFIHLFTVEYFIGLEILRPLVLWLVISTREKATWQDRLKKVAATWLPYFAVLVFFVYWRSFVLPTTAARHDPVSALFNSGRIILSVSRNVFADLALMLISSWFKLINPQLFVIGPRRNLYFWGAAVVAGLAFYFLSKPASDTGDQSNEPRQIGLAGIVTIMAGMIAPYAVGYVLHEKVSPWNSRFSLPALLGLSLLISWLINTLITSRPARHIFFAIVIGLLAGFHNYNTLDFKTAWEKQERLYQQLVWRAPAIEPGTAIIANEEILGYMGDYPASFAINTIYESKQFDHVPYWFFAISENFNFKADAILDTEWINTQRATINFTGKSADAIMISYEPENNQCLWVLRPEDSDHRSLPSEMQKAVQISNYENIRNVETEHPLFNTIVEEDRNTWCYYYQKADLARQTQDWSTVTGYWDEARQKGYSPGNGFEYIVFIESYAHLGQWEDALKLTSNADSVSPAMYFILCPTWERLANETPASSEKDAHVFEANDMLRCAP